MPKIAVTGVLPDLLWEWSKAHLKSLLLHLLSDPHRPVVLVQALNKYTSVITSHHAMHCIAMLLGRFLDLDTAFSMSALLSLASFMSISSPFKTKGSPER